jgi:hypothetical protein
VFFKDIFRVSIEIIDRDNRILTKDFERVLIQDGDQPIKNLVNLVLKVHFMVNEEKKSDTMAGF